MMNCWILGLGTAVPPDAMPQEELLSMSTDVICENPRQERLMRVLFRSAGIETRRSVLPWQLGYEWKKRPDAVSPGHGPRTAERMQIYGEFALQLAATACNRALDDAKVKADEITHLVTVSCTGFGAPGVDIGLIQSLGLPATTQRLHLGFMGCHGAINGMRAVRGLVAADPHAKVLMCAVEICSLHFRLTWDDEGIIGNALFSDGAAAIVASGDSGGDASLWEIGGSGSCLIPDSTEAMSWHVGDHGFDMRLTGKVSDSIKGGLRPWMESWLNSLNCSMDAVGGWAVHPGSSRIVDAVEAALDLTADATAKSRSVLREHGNMSSPTVLFVFDRMREAVTPGPIVALAFGPGLMAEAAFLHRAQ